MHLAAAIELNGEADSRNVCAASTASASGLLAKGRQMTPLLNTAILTDDGHFGLETISLDDAKDIIRLFGGEILSAIGHQATADILSDLLEIPVPMNRIEFKQQVGQTAIVFKLRGRVPEGMILTRGEVERIGYDLKRLDRYPPVRHPA